MVKRKSSETIYWASGWSHGEAGTGVEEKAIG
jgi:hypothetical protein